MNVLSFAEYDHVVKSPFLTRQTLLKQEGRLGLTLRYYKKVAGNHLQLSPNLSYSHYVRYYHPGQGYYYGGHPMLIDSDHLDTGFMPVYARILPSYLMFKILNMYYKRSISREGLRVIDNPHLFQNSQLSYLKKHFKVKPDSQSFVKGDLFLVGNDLKLKVETKMKGACKLRNYGVLHLQSSSSPGNYWLNYSQLRDLPNKKVSTTKGYCPHGSQIELSAETLKTLNASFVTNAYQRNLNHQELVKEYISPPLYRDINLDKEISFCSGGKTGQYHHFARSFRGGLSSSIKVGIVSTHGSNENLIKLSDGLCNGAVVQEDIFKKYQKRYKVDFLYSKGTLFKEKMYLICHENTKLHSSQALSGNDTLLIGGIGSGAAATFAMLGKKQTNLLKVRKKFLPSFEAIRSIITDKEKAGCLFHVSSPGSPFLKHVENLPSLKFIPITAPASGYELVQIDKTKFPHLTRGESISTLQLNAVAVFDRLWEQENLTPSMKELLTKKLFAMDKKSDPLNRDTSSLKLCSGPINGSYYLFMEEIKNKFPDSKITILPTSGSMDNLELLAQGKCDMALVQEDVYKAKNKLGSLAKFEVMPDPLFKEAGLLFCHQSVRADHINKLNDWWVKVYQGPAKSGTSFTWEKIKSSFPNLKNMSRLNTSKGDALKQMLKKQRDCLFTVSSINRDLFEASFTKLLSVHPDLKVLPISGNAHNYGHLMLTSDFLPFLNSEQSIRTIEVSTLLIYRPEKFGTVKSKSVILHQLKNTLNR